MRSIAEEIKRIRKALDWNQHEFAEALGASQGSVSKWERGLETPRPDVLYRIRGLYEIEETNVDGGSFDFNAIPEIIDIPMTGALLGPSDEDLYSGAVRPIATLRLPRHPRVKGPVTAWMVPRMQHNIGYKAGQIIFTHRDTIERPDDGEELLVRETIHNGKYVYMPRYYGSSEKGFEWFTSSPATAKQVSLDAAIPFGQREAHGIFPAGIVFASLKYESARQRFWQGVWPTGDDDYSNTNF